MLEDACTNVFGHIGLRATGSGAGTIPDRRPELIVPPVLVSVSAKQRWDITLQPKLVPVQQVDTLDWKTYFRWTGQLMKEAR